MPVCVCVCVFVCLCVSEKLRSFCDNSAGSSCFGVCEREKINLVFVEGISKDMQIYKYHACVILLRRVLCCRVYNLPKTYEHLEILGWLELRCSTVLCIHILCIHTDTQTHMHTHIHTHRIAVRYNLPHMCRPPVHASQANRVTPYEIRIHNSHMPLPTPTCVQSEVSYNYFLDSYTVAASKPYERGEQVRADGVCVSVYVCMCAVCVC